MIDFSEITPANLHLIKNEIDQMQELVYKLADWQINYSGIPWEKFKESYYKCDRCDGYDYEPCICYAR